MQPENIPSELETVNRDDIALEEKRSENNNNKKKKIAGGKGKKGKVKGRNWTKEETNLFVDLLVELHLTCQTTFRS